MKRYSKGFTIVETLIGASVFVVVAMAIYSSYVNLFRFMNAAQYQELAVNLAEEQMEIIRNMPYSDVGVQGSIPNGNIPYQQNFLRGGIPFTITTIVRNIDLAADSKIGGTPNDTAPNDNKLVSLSVSCETCPNMKPFSITGQVAPLSLESSGNTGSLFVHVYDAVGGNIQGANVRVTNDQGTSTITINDVTDDSGTLALVGVPPGTRAYNISVTKAGYSTDQTYPLGGIDNPNPINVDANVVTGQVTAVSFFIDKLSSLNVFSVSPSCASVPSFDFNLTGSKQIGLNTPKYDQNLITNSLGALSLAGLEWDTSYSIVPMDSEYDLAGVTPSNPLSVNPGSNVNVQLVVVPKNSRALMVSVTDASTGLPLSGASVELSGNGYDNTQITGQGFINQNDWSGGSGQEAYVNTNKYWYDDNNLDTAVTGTIRLRNSFGVYNTSGMLESSTFDTGTTSNFYNFIWSPTNEPASTSISFQFATASSSTPSPGWNFTGPDGSSSSYYSVSNSALHENLNGNRYARYRAFLNTATSSITPTVSGIGFTYTSACIPPGQVLFQGLVSGTYTISISKSGYNTAVSTTTISDNWQQKSQALTQ